MSGRAWRRPRGRALIWLVIGAVLVAAVLVWRAAGSSDPVSEEDALADFRAGPGSGAAAGGPRPGVYAYSAAGSERGGAGPLKVTRSIPSVARLVVIPAASGWDAEISYSRQHVEGAHYVRADDGIRIARRRTKVTFAGFGRDDRREVSPPSLFLPSRPTVGASWEETYRTGDLTVRARSRVDRAERLRLDGRDVPVIVVVSHSDTDGPHPGTRDETVWWAPSLGLPVRWDVVMDIGGVFAFSADTSISLESAVPRT